MWHRLSIMPRGGQGYTYLVIRPSDQNHENPSKFVVKRLSHQKSAQARARMCAEVASLGLVSHKSVAKLVDTNVSVGDESSDFYMVTEFVPGVHIADAVREQKPSVEEAISCTLGILRTLDSCHRAGVVHRDIKPENVILRDSDWSDPVLIDFGISFNHDVSGETRHSESFGNKFIHLPELQGSGEYIRDPRCDVSAACGILYFLLTGASPRLLVDEGGKSPCQRKNWVDFVRNKSGGLLASRIEHFLSMGFQYAIVDRWPSASEAAEALERTLMDQSEELSYKDQLKALCARLDSSQAHVSANAASEVYKHVQMSFRRSVDDAVKELGQHITGGVSQSTTDVQKWEGLHEAYLTPKHSSVHSQRIRISIKRNENTIILNGTSGSRKDVIGQFSIANPEIKQEIDRVIDKFVFDCLDRFTGIVYG